MYNKQVNDMVFWKLNIKDYMISNKCVERFLYVVVFSGLFVLACSRTRELSTTAVITKADETAVEHPAGLPEMEQEIPPPDAGERDFYMIQLLATQSFDRARKEKNRLREYTGKTIYLVNEKNLWKVQIGDFISRDESEKERNIMRKLGWIDAWILQYRASTVPYEAEKESTHTPEVNPRTLLYTVQLIATANKTEVENMHRNLILLNITDAVVIKDGVFWKIQVGSYGEYNDAVNMLNRMREMGFNDSWITKR